MGNLRYSQVVKARSKFIKNSGFDIRMKYSLIVIFLLAVASPSVADDLTRLRASSPTGTFVTRRGNTELESAQVKVRNAGAVEARDITVMVVVASGRTARLYGPRTLEPYKSATYSSDAAYVPITKAGKLKAEVSCSNCR